MEKVNVLIRWSSCEKREIETYVLDLINKAGTQFIKLTEDELYKLIELYNNANKNEPVSIELFQDKTCILYSAVHETSDNYSMIYKISPDSYEIVKYPPRNRLSFTVWTEVILFES